MNDFLNSLFDNRIVFFVTLIITILSFIWLLVDIVLRVKRRKSKPRKELSCAKKTTCLIGKASGIERLSVKFDDTEIQSLWSTNISIVNSGNKDICESDFLEILKINFGDNNILQYDIITDDKITHNDMSENKKVISLKFKYLRPKEDIRLAILHKTKTVDISAVIRDGVFRNFEETRIKKEKLAIIRAFIDVFVENSAITAILNLADTMFQHD